MVAWKNFFSSVVLTATSAAFETRGDFAPGLPAPQSCLVYSVHAAPAHDFNVHVFFKPSQAIVSDLILALLLKLEYVLVSTKPRLETTSLAASRLLRPPSPSWCETSSPRFSSPRHPHLARLSSPLYACPRCRSSSRSSSPRSYRSTTGLLIDDSATGPPFTCGNMSDM